jgi:hypothetical protein
MLKSLSVPDFHFDVGYAELSKQLGRAVAAAAIENDVDFIKVPGDWFNRPIIASDKGGLKAAKEIMQEWLSICPVIAIEGTRSHDAPGCYGIFEEMGLVVARPGKVYGFHVEHESHTFIIEVGKSHLYPKAIIFGFPEITKENIYSVLDIPAEQANAEALKLFKEYIETWVAPMREKYRDLPAYGLLHGPVTDSISKETETDRILKRAEILISTDVLRLSRIDYFALGHIHTPWKSASIAAGYAGSPGFTFNELNFKPGFELITVQPGNPCITETTRILYGTPERRKVKSFDEIDVGRSDIAYSVETTEATPENFPECFGIHKWSRHILPPDTSTTQRVTEEQAADVHSLWDLFKLIDPEVPDKIKKKVDIIGANLPPVHPERKDIALEKLEVIGCDFFQGRTVEFDLSNVKKGVTSIHGEIGAGKSSLLSFCSPYPIVIGKETQSGRPSAIKDFFSSKESSIKKTFNVNGEKHEHKIHIKAAHTKNPKIECYLNIDNVPQLEKGTFDEMMAECEKFYGAFEDYRLTTFYEQPQQSTKNQSGLMTATRTEARNVIQNIAGINRDAEKDFALKKANAAKDDYTNTETKISVMKEQLPSRDDVFKEIAELDGRLQIEGENLSKINVAGEKARREYDDLIREKHENDIRVKEVEAMREKLDGNLQAVMHKQAQIKMLEAKAAELTRNREIVLNYESGLERLRKLEGEKQEVDKRNFDREKNQWEIEQKIRQKEDSLKGERKEIQISLSSMKERINTLYTPCEHCGKLPSNAESEITRLEKSIKDLNVKHEKITNEILEIKYPHKPEQETFDHDHELNNLKSIKTINVTMVKSDIEEGIKAEATIKSLTAEIESMQSEVAPLQEAIHGIKIDETIPARVIDSDARLKKIRENFTETTRNIATIETEIKGKNEILSGIAEKENEIKDNEKKLKVILEQQEDWTYITRMLSPDKIPALELEILISGIDGEASRIISPFMNSRYTFQTVTQVEGQKKTVDKFDIMIHDNETGELKSMFFKNPGHKSFYSDAYIKALIKKRKEKAAINYSPIILDEADAPISPEQIASFYEIQNEYFENEKVLTVSHSSDAQQYIPNTIEMEDLKT